MEEIIKDIAERMINITGHQERFERFKVALENGDRKHSDNLAYYSFVSFVIK